jgi:integrase
LWLGIKELCELADVKFKSPHKLRHGHGVYGVMHARNMAELKALSQNMMHANVGITDGIYGRLKTDEMKNILASFTE